MNEDGDDSGNSTRRSVLTGVGTSVTSGLPAGCTAPGGTDSTETTTATGTETATETSTSTETADSEGPYTVSIEPVGEVEVESVPKTWVANNGSWADIVSGGF